MVLGGLAVSDERGTPVAGGEIGNSLITSVSAALATHCATYCTPCRPLIGAFSDVSGGGGAGRDAHDRGDGLLNPDPCTLNPEP